MGINSLTGFIHNNREKLLERYELKDTRLVVNSQCIYRLLNDYYHRHRVNGHERSHERLTNYVQFEAHFRSLLKLFDECNIQPYIVFRLNYTRDYVDHYVRNDDNVTFREDTLNTSCKPCPTIVVESYKTSSLIRGEVMLQVIKELGIPFIRSVNTLDYDMAKLANDLQCPLLTDDSDLYIYDIEHGLINSREIDADHMWSAIEGRLKVTALKTRLYRRSKFLSVFDGFRPECFPVFAAIMGGQRDNLLPNYVSLGNLCKTLPDWSDYHNGYLFIIDKELTLYKVIRWFENKTFEDGLTLVKSSGLFDDVHLNAITQMSHKLSGWYTNGGPDATQCLMKHVTGNGYCDEKHKLRSDLANPEQIASRLMSVEIQWLSAYFAIVSQQFEEQPAVNHVRMAFQQVFRSMYIDHKEIEPENKRQYLFEVLKTTDEEFEVFCTMAQNLTNSHEQPIVKSLAIVFAIIKLKHKMMKERTKPLFREVARAIVISSRYHLTGESGPNNERTIEKEVQYGNPSFVNCYNEFEAILINFNRLNVLINGELTIHDGNFLNGILIHNLASQKQIQEIPLDVCEILDYLFK